MSIAPQPPLPVSGSPAYAVLGAMILSPEARSQVMERGLTRPGAAEGWAAHVYNIIVNATLAGQPIDAVYVASRVHPAIGARTIHRCLLAASPGMDLAPLLDEVFGVQD